MQPTAPGFALVRSFVAALPISNAPRAKYAWKIRQIHAIRETAAPIAGVFAASKNLSARMLFESSAFPRHVGREAPQGVRKLSK